MIFNVDQSINQKINLPAKYSVELYLKREDAIHPFVSGNKYRKLRHNLKKAQQQNAKLLITFGGAYSNHIAAVAFAGQAYGFKTLGIIRGEELEHKINGNATLTYAKACGMDLKFISRSNYKQKHTPEFINNLEKNYNNFYLIPEGGTNNLAIKGCEEILTDNDKIFNYVCCAVGTGGTISGLINSASKNQKILGFPALKGSFLQEDISKFVSNRNWKLITDYHFGGYGKVKNELVSFINQFKLEQKILLDPIYTAKMMFGIYSMLDSGYFEPGSKILAIHTGGLQGIAGINSILKNKKLPLISY